MNRSNSQSQPRNALTVDVEEHFQVSAFESVVDRAGWDSIPSRVEANTERLLELFARAGVHGTFFVLGWVAERHPDLVRRIAGAGHEIASHGQTHRLIYDQDPETFRAETHRSRATLQDLSGQPVSGYRAASFSITRQSLWALDVLVEEGFAWDSSVFPVLHDRYGVPGARRGPHRLRAPGGGELLELPPSTVALGRATLPVGGGGYLRLYPLAVTAWAIRRLNRRDGLPAVVYVHPWEVDPEQPRIRASFRSRFRHYTGLRTTAPKLGRLLERFRFGTMSELAADHASAGDAPREIE
jgi:polysaccharide deacetylase family protein (PEP-CTERM system associated)